MKKGGGVGRGYVFREDSSGGAHKEEGEVRPSLCVLWSSRWSI